MVFIVDWNIVGGGMVGNQTHTDLKGEGRERVTSWCVKLYSLINCVLDGSVLNVLNLFFGECGFS